MPAPNIEVDEHPSERAAEIIVGFLRQAVSEHGDAALAVSGGSTAPPMLAALAAVDLPWDVIDVYQVDERVAPDGDPARNANELAGLPGRHHLMPVTADDLEQAAARYAAELPDRLDVVHLGMGPDGHTASWPPGDPVIDRTERVALSGEYQGHIRMTLTPPVVNGAGARVVLVTGTDKADSVAAWLGSGEAGDPGAAPLPISRVTSTGTTVVLDAAAAARLRPA